MKRIISVVLAVVMGCLLSIPASAETDVQTAKAAMDEAKAAYEDFLLPYPNPTGPMRLLSQSAQNRHMALRTEINSWFQGAYQYAQHDIESLIDLYEQAADKWRSALETVKNLGYVDTTQAERDRASRIANSVRYLLSSEWLRWDVDIQPGKVFPLGLMRQEVDPLVPEDECALIKVLQSGLLEANAQEAKEKVLEIMATFLTEQGLRDVLDCDMYYPKYITLDALLRESTQGSDLYLVNQVVNGPMPEEITEAQRQALASLETEGQALYKHFGPTSPMTYRGAANYCHFQLWLYSEVARIFSVDITPYIGTISKPVIPDNPVDPPTPPTPPEPSHFWDTWPPFFQWILKYLLFGWLWMQWV